MTVQDFAGFGAGGDDYFEIRRDDGSVLAASPSLHRPAGQLLASAGGAGGAGMRGGWLSDGRPARFFVERFQPKDDDHNEYRDLILIAASPTRQLRRSLFALGSVIAGVGALAMLVAALLLRVVLVRSLRPLDSLGRQVAEIPVSRLDQRLELAGQPDELLPLGASLNAWLDRMEASFERERRFSSHAAHELRTPLAELKAIAEIGVTWPDEANPERFREMISVVDELEALVAKLSLLASSDAGARPVRMEAVDLRATVEAAIEWETAAADERGIAIRREITDGDFQADAVLWGGILHNLIGNSVAHAPVGSEVTVVATPGFLRVSNPAPDLSPDDLERLFERFWRKDTSHRGDRHSGLGLSIVKASVTLLDGTVGARLSGGTLEMEAHWRH
jgi:signal transduction histidine kinase